MVAPVERIRDYGEIIYSAHVLPDVNVGEVSIFTTGSFYRGLRGRSTTVRGMM